MIRAIKVSYDTSNLVRDDFAIRPPSAMTIKVPLARRPGAEVEEST
jgi:hypothetical protein